MIEASTFYVHTPAVYHIAYYHHGSPVTRREAESRIYAYHTTYGDDVGDLQALWDEAHFSGEAGDSARLFMLEALDLEIDLTEAF